MENIRSDLAKSSITLNGAGSSSPGHYLGGNMTVFGHGGMGVRSCLVICEWETSAFW